MKIPQPKILLKDDNLVLAAVAGTSKRLVVVVASYDLPDKVIAPRPMRYYDLVSQGGRNSVLCATDVKWDWMSTPGVLTDLTQRIRRYAQEIGATEIYGYGNSGGARNIIQLNEYIDFDGVFAIAPQIDAGAALRAFDNSWSAWEQNIPKERNIPTITAGLKAGRNIVILHGLRGADAAHAAMTPYLPNVRHYLFPDVGHTLSKPLRKIGSLLGMVDAFLDGRMDDLHAQLTTAGAIPRGVLEYTPPKGGWDEQESEPRQSSLFRRRKKQLRAWITGRRWTKNAGVSSMEGTKK